MNLCMPIEAIIVQHITCKPNKLCAERQNYVVYCPHNTDRATSGCCYVHMQARPEMSTSFKYMPKIISQILKETPKCGLYTIIC